MKIPNPYNLLTNTIISIIVSATIFLLVCLATWMVRNPKANEFTFFTHFTDVITFKTLPQFQE